MSVKYPRTDLACEANVELAHINGTEYKIEDRDICIVEHLDILSDEASRKLSKNIGSYITVSTPRVQYLDERDAVKISSSFSLFPTIIFSTSSIRRVAILLAFDIFTYHIYTILTMIDPKLKYTSSAKKSYIEQTSVIFLKLFL